MLRIRLTRTGKRKQPSYRLVLADSRSPRDGAFLKILGHYNPLTDPATLVVKEDETVHWLQRGAQPSETVAKLLTRIGVMERAGRPAVVYQPKAVPPKPKKKAKEEAPALAAPAAEAAKAETTEEAEAAAEAPEEPLPPETVEGQQATADTSEETPAPEPEVPPAEAEGEQSGDSDTE